MKYFLVVLALAAVALASGSPVPDDEVLEMNSVDVDSLVELLRARRASDCNPLACDQFCHRIGRRGGGVCVGGKCKCDIF